MKTLPIITLLVVLTINFVSAQNEKDEKLIHQTVQEYIDGYWDGDVEKINNSLHPEFIKRHVIKHSKTGRNLIKSEGKTNFVEYAIARRNGDANQEKGTVKITILDYTSKLATVKGVSDKYIDYIHLVKWNNEWKILDIVWDYNETE